MLGGQINKLFRPLGISISIIIIYCLWHNHEWWCVLPIIFHGGIEIIGYGENSRLMKWFEDKQEVNIVLGLIISIPVIFISVLTMNFIALIFFPIIVAVECIRMGSWGKIGKYDILPTDIFRGLVLGTAVSCALI